MIAVGIVEWLANMVSVSRIRVKASNPEAGDGLVFSRDMGSGVAVVAKRLLVAFLPIPSPVY